MSLLCHPRLMEVTPLNHFFSGHTLSPKNPVRASDDSYIGTSIKGTSNGTIIQAVRATTAAPTYFEPLKIILDGSNHVLVDGGVGHNNPTLLGIAEAKSIGMGDIETIVSLGTGKMSNGSAIRKEAGTIEVNLMGIVQCMVNVLTDGESIHKEVMRQYQGHPTTRCFRFNPSGLSAYKMDESSDLNMLSMVLKTREYLREEEDQLRQLIPRLTDGVPAIK